MSTVTPATAPDCFLFLFFSFLHVWNSARLVFWFGEIFFFFFLFSIFFFFFYSRGGKGGGGNHEKEGRRRRGLREVRSGMG